jgi:hypothetical protein
MDAWTRVLVGVAIQGRHRVLTCRIASLCISPVHAGIKPLRTANSSFIFDLRRRSMRLWAVFLAIFLPVEPVPVVLLGAVFEFDAGVSGLGSSRGFIWMILRERVGGGGRANWSLGGFAADDRLRDLTVSLACVGKKVADVLGRFDPPSLATAGGGNSKASWSEAILEPSWPLMSVDDPGVGRNVFRGIVVIWGAEYGCVMKGEVSRAMWPGRMARAQLLTGRAAELGTYSQTGGLFELCDDLRGQVVRPAY